MFTTRSAGPIVAVAVAAAAVLPAQALAVRPQSGQITSRAPSAAVATTPYTFVGTTAQQPCQLDTENVFCGGVNVFMSKDMKRVKRLIVGFEATCQVPGKYFGTNIILQGIPAKPSRRGSTFAADTNMEASLGDDLTARVQVGVDGRARLGSTGRGKFTITIGIIDGSGRQIDTCETGRQSFNLRALKRR
jgi:hypothetical protein